jgi:hypothetical protein
MNHLANRWPVHWFSGRHGPIRTDTVVALESHDPLGAGLEQQLEQYAGDAAGENITLAALTRFGRRVGRCYDRL